MSDPAIGTGARGLTYMSKCGVVESEGVCSTGRWESIVARLGGAALARPLCLSSQIVLCLCEAPSRSLPSGFPTLDFQLPQDTF